MTITYRSHEGELAAQPRRPAFGSLLKGLRLRCPACNKGRILKGYLKVADRCEACGEAFHHQRADDAPAYFTVLITGHVIAPAMLLALTSTTWPFWVHLTLWPSVAIAMMGTMLPRIKGALVSLQWALRMHGFAGEGDDIPMAP